MLQLNLFVWARNLKIRGRKFEKRDTGLNMGLNNAGPGLNNGNPGLNNGNPGLNKGLNNAGPGLNNGGTGLNNGCSRSKNCSFEVSVARFLSVLHEKL